MVRVRHFSSIVDPTLRFSFVSPPHSADHKATPLGDNCNENSTEEPESTEDDWHANKCHKRHCRTPVQANREHIDNEAANRVEQAANQADVSHPLR